MIDFIHERTPGMDGNNVVRLRYTHQIEPAQRLQAMLEEKNHVENGIRRRIKNKLWEMVRHLPLSNEYVLDVHTRRYGDDIKEPYQQRVQNIMGMCHSVAMALSSSKEEYLKILDETYNLVEKISAE